MSTGKHSPRCKMYWHTRFFLVVTACFISASAAFAQEKIGSITGSQGSSVIVRANNDIPVTNGIEIKAGDFVRTTENAKVSVTFIDGTRVLIGPATQVSIDSYAFNPADQKGNMLVGVIKGSMRMISGLITKANPGQAVIKTATATAGLRGTDIIVEVP